MWRMAVNISGKNTMVCVECAQFMSHSEYKKQFGEEFKC